MCSIVDLKDGPEGKKRDTKDFEAYAQCADTIDMKDGNEKGKETQNTFPSICAVHRCLWSQRWE